MQQRIFSADLYDIVRDIGHGRITHNTDDHKNDVGRTGEKVLIQLEHIFEYGWADAPEDITDRQPHIYVDVAGEPMHQRLVEAVENT